MKVTEHMQLKYKNFSCLVGYSQVDGYFFGRILGIPEPIYFRGKTEDGLKNAFCEAVDNYLVMHDDADIIPSCKLPFSDLSQSKECTVA